MLKRRERKALSRFPIFYLVEMKASEAITGVFNSPPGEKSDRSRSRFKAAEVTSKRVFERSWRFLQSRDFTIQWSVTFFIPFKIKVRDGTFDLEKVSIRKGAS